MSINNYDLLIDQGIIHVKDFDYENALKKFNEAANMDEKNFKAHLNISNIYILKKDIKGCADYLFKYLKRYGFEKNIANHLGSVLINYNLENDLEVLFKITKLKNKDITEEKNYLYFLKAYYLENKLHFDQAISFYKLSILCNENFFDSYEKIFNLLESKNLINQLEKFVDLSKKIFHSKKEKNIIIFFQSVILHRKKKFKDSNSIIKKNNLIFNFKSQAQYYIRTIDLRAKNNEQLENFLDAFKDFEARNNFIKNLDQNKNYNKKNILETIDKYKNFYSKKNIEYITNSLSYDNSLNIVFLVGFPRSGTTLLDSILRSHSKINVIEENPILLDLRHTFFKSKNNDLNSLKFITQNEKDQICKDYFNKINLKENFKDNIIIDKLPLSIIEIGFIKCIFPKSKIILSLRHPSDVIFSCFSTLFKMNDAMINFTDWDDTVDFYNEVFSLFELYEQHLNLDYYPIKYEDIVYDFKNQLIRLLDFLGLDFESSLNNFYKVAKSRSKISTPSYNQVINPLYNTSINRWKKYSKIINSEKKINKWIKKFNY